MAGYSNQLLSPSNVPFHGGGVFRLGAACREAGKDRGQKIHDVGVVSSQELQCDLWFLLTKHSQKFGEDQERSPVVRTRLRRNER